MGPKEDSSKTEKSSSSKKKEIDILLLISEKISNLQEELVRSREEQTRITLRIKDQHEKIGQDLLTCIQNLERISTHHSSHSSSQPLHEVPDSTAHMEIQLKNEAFNSRRRLRIPWQQKLNHRKQMYWNHIKNQGLYELYEKWLNQSPPHIPRKYLPKHIQGEPENEEKIRYSLAIDEMKMNQELFASRATRFLSKTETADIEMKEFIQSKCTPPVLQDLIYNIWKDDCLREEAKSRLIWEKKCRWHEDKRMEAIYAREKNDTTNTSNSRRNSPNYRRINNYRKRSPSNHDRYVSPRFFKPRSNRRYNNNIQDSRWNYRRPPPSSPSPLTKGQWQRRGPTNRPPVQNNRYQSRYRPMTINRRYQNHRNQSYSRAFNQNYPRRNAHRPRYQEHRIRTNHQTPQVRQNNYNQFRSRSRTRQDRRRTFRNNYSTSRSRSQSFSRSRSNSRFRYPRSYDNRRSFLAGVGRNVTFREETQFITSRLDQEQQDLDHAIAMSVAEAEAEVEAAAQTTINTRGDQLDESETYVKDLYSPPTTNQM